MSLNLIAKDVQNISEAISSVLKVDVTIIDNAFTRVAGTGKYQSFIGKPVSEFSAFGYAMQTKQELIINNPGKHIACERCENRETCVEHAEVCCPIRCDDQILGIIGLIAFDDDQKKRLISEEHTLMNFLNKMAGLISSKYREVLKNHEVKVIANELNAVINSVDKGILSFDDKGHLIKANDKGEALLELKGYEDFSDLFGLSVDDVLNTNERVNNRSFAYQIGNETFRGVFDAKVLTLDGMTQGIVVLFSPLTDVFKTIYDFSGPNMAIDFEDIIGNSVLIRETKRQAMMASRSNSNVLILGESGTGKELFARAIHYTGFRKNKPFVAINCAAIPEQLLESELFGYEEGAFSGAKAGGKPGKFELADGGTLFLDEIGDMPLHLQVKILRAIQEGTIEKLGATQALTVDVRIIAATNKNLEKKVLDGEFRQDLFYRLNVLPITIPPVHERSGDLELLLSSFIDKCSVKLNKKVTGIDLSALNRLKAYEWPGNVREIENVIEYAVNMCQGDTLFESDLPKSLIQGEQKVPAEHAVLDQPLKALEKQAIEFALNQFKGEKAMMDLTAKKLGLGRATLYRKLKEYDITIS